MSVRSDYRAGGGYRTSEDQVFHYSHKERWQGTSRLVIALHGTGGTAITCRQTSKTTSSGQAPFSATFLPLVRTGRYVVLAIEAAGVRNWSKPDTMTAIDDAVTWARARGAKTGKYGLIGYSMGALSVANKLKRDHANIAAAWAFSGLLDLDFAYSSAGHSPQAGSAEWMSDIDTAYGSYAATAGYRVWDEPASYQSLGVPWKIFYSTGDEIVPSSIPTTFLSAVNDVNVTARSPVPTSTHVGLLSDATDAEVVAHFDSGSW